MTDWSIAAYKSRIYEKEEAGKGIIRLDVGAPDFDCPQIVKNGVKDALRRGYTSYSNPMGILPLREALSESYSCSYDVELSPKNVVITPGSKYAIFSSLYSLLKNDDEVLVFEPYWMDYFHMCKILGKKLVTILLHDDGKNFYFNEENLKSKISKRTKAIILNSPHHPTGKIFSKEEINLVADLANDRGIYIISDEIYDRISFDGHVSILKVVDSIENVILTNGFSKSYAMSGFRVGYAIANENLAKRITYFQINTTRCAASISQYGAVVALKNPEVTRKMTNEYRVRSNTLWEILNQLKPIRCTKPQGTFYLFADFSFIEKDSYKIIEEMLECGIAALPGALFGQHFKSYLRFAVTTKLSKIKESHERIRKWLARNNYQNNKIGMG